MALVAWCASAQSQFSDNAVGYVDVNLVAGSNLVANPLNAGDNSVSNIFRGVPDGTVFLAWERASASFPSSNVFHTATGWTDPTAQLTQPQGAFLWVPAPTPLSFVGQLAWPAFPFGCYMCGNIEVMAMPSGECGFCDPGPCPSVVPDFTILARWDRARQEWKQYTYWSELGGWIDSGGNVVDSTLGPGEAGMFSFNQSFNARFPFTILANPAPPPVRLSSWRRDQAELSFRVPGQTNTGYTLLYSTNLGLGWMLWSNGIAGATNGEIVLRAPIETNRQAFYKIGALSPPAYLFNMSRTNTQFRFQFFASQGVNYAVQRKTSLDAPSWQTIQNVAGHGGLQTVTDANATALSGYYRLQF